MLYKLPFWRNILLVCSRFLQLAGRINYRDQNYTVVNGESSPRVNDLNLYPRLICNRVTVRQTYIKCHSEVWWKFLLFFVVVFTEQSKKKSHLPCSVWVTEPGVCCPQPLSSHQNILQQSGSRSVLSWHRIFLALKYTFLMEKIAQHFHLILFNIQPSCCFMPCHTFPILPSPALHEWMKWCQCTILALDLHTFCPDDCSVFWWLETQYQRYLSLSCVCAPVLWVYTWNAWGSWI